MDWRRKNGLWTLVPSLDSESLDVLFNLSNPQFLNLKKNGKGKHIRITTHGKIALVLEIGN
jgi:hypothetical protein